MFRHMLQYKKEITIISILGIVSALANGAVPYVVGLFFDSILAGGSVSFFGKAIYMWVALLGIWFVMQTIANVIDWRLSLKSSKLGNSVYFSYVAKGYENLYHLPLSFHKNNRTGEVSSKIQRAANWIDQIISRVIVNLGPQFLSIIVGIGFVLYIRPVAAVPMVVGILVYIVLIIKVNNSAENLQEKVWKGYGDGFGKAHDALSNIDAVKKFAAEGFVSRRVKTQFTKKTAGILYKRDQLWSSVSFYQKLVVVLVQLSVFILSVFYIQRGEMTLGELIALNGYAAMFFGPFVNLGFNWESIQNGLVGIQDAQKIFKKPQENYYPKNSIDIDYINGNVVFRDVNFSYKKGGGKVLESINFNINAGEVVALVGESGVGKSTLIDLIGGFYFPTKGKVFIDGYDNTKFNLDFLRNNIAYVPQEVVLFNDTVLNNLKFAKQDASEEEIIEAAKKAKAHEFIEKFPEGYKSKVGERGVKLSVGQKQRIAIARAILRDPKILILDEPTSALDAKTEKALTGSLEELMEGRTTIIIAHRLSTVRRADKIIVLDKGKVVEVGTHKELMRKKGGIYKELYELQFQEADRASSALPSNSSDRDSI